MSSPNNPTTNMAGSSSSMKTLSVEISDFMKREGSNSSAVSNHLYSSNERHHYDFAAERHNPYATNLPEAISYLVKGCLGAGILTMPEAFKYGGMVASTLVAMLVGYLIAYCMTILITSAQKMYVMLRLSRLTYPDLVEAAVATGPKSVRKYSKFFRYTIESFIFLEMSGSCSVFQLMIAKTLKVLLEYFCEACHKLSLRSYVVLITIPLLFFCLIRKWRNLALLYFIANLFLGVGIITTMGYSIAQMEYITKRVMWRSVSGLFKFIGICLYSMDAMQLVLPIENNMKSPHHVKFVIHCGMIFVCITVTLAGFIGYWAWGEAASSPMTIHLPLDIIPVILQFMIIASLLLTFMIQYWVPFRIIWHHVGHTHEDQYGNNTKWEYICRAVYLMFITCISMIFPKMESLMIFLGDFFVSTNSFIFPAFIELLLTWNSYRPGQTKWCLIKDVCIGLLGIILCCGGICCLLD